MGRFSTPHKTFLPARKKVKSSSYQEKTAAAAAFRSEVVEKAASASAFTLSEALKVGLTYFLGLR
jgi:hypothetical protein